MTDIRTLPDVFGSEWETISTDDRGMIRADWREAMDKYGDMPADYARNIGRGNLVAYVACLRASQFTYDAADGAE